MHFKSRALVVGGIAVAALIAALVTAMIRSNRHRDERSSRVASASTSSPQPPLAIETPAPAKPAAAPPFATCVGRLQYDDGSPVAHERVGLDPAPRDGATTDDEGRFRIECRVARTGRRLMLGTDASSVAIGGVDLRPGAEVRADFTVRRGFEQELEVVTAESEQFVSDAWVRISRPEGSYGEQARKAEGWTSPAGRVAFAHLVEGVYLVRVGSQGRRHFQETLDLTNGPRREPIRIALVESTKILVRVDGWPNGRSGDFDLHLTAASGSAGITDSLRTDGTYTWDAPAAGTYRVAFECEGWKWETKDFVVPDSGTAELVVTRPHDGVSVRGIVVDDEEKPVGDIPLRLVNADESVARTGGTEDDGTFEIDLVPPGRYAWEIANDFCCYRGVWPDVEVPSTGIADLRLRLPNASISGREVFRPNGNPSLFDRVSLARRDESEWRDRGWTFVNEKGRFEASFLDAGDWRLGLQPATYGEASVTFGRPVAVHVDAGATVQGIELSWDPCPTVEFVVRASGAALTDSYWASIAPLPRKDWTRDFDLQPDANGRCKVKTIPPGRFDLTVRKGPDTLAAQAIDVVDGVNAPIEIVLEKR